MRRPEYHSIRHPGKCLVVELSGDRGSGRTSMARLMARVLSSTGRAALVVGHKEDTLYTSDGRETKIGKRSNGLIGHRVEAVIYDDID